MFDLWFSAEAAEDFGYSIYEGVNGDRIKVTCAISEGKGCADNYKWPDKKYVGKGVRILESHHKDPFGVSGIFDGAFDEEESEKSHQDSCERMLKYIAKKRAALN